jgi:methionine--tRNA ligase beta chain
MENIINFNDFKKIDLRIGKIIESEKVEKSDKLLKLRVDIGEEVREIISGIAEFYNSEDLINKNVLVVINLEPRKIMGLESQGMLLAAEGKDRPVLLIPEDDVFLGSKIN